MNGEDFFTYNHYYYQNQFTCIWIMMTFDELGSSCVIVHNNWIKGQQAKIYRFKELGFYYPYNDTKYYSDQNRYLLFDIPKTLIAPSMSLKSTVWENSLSDTSASADDLFSYGDESHSDSPQVPLFWTFSLWEESCSTGRGGELSSYFGVWAGCSLRLLYNEWVDSWNHSWTAFQL